MKLLFTPSGRLQFLRALSYIQEDNPQAAAKFRKGTERALRRLKMYPESGRIIPEFPDLPFREVIVAPYRFSYRCAGRTIWVVACWHGAQLPIEPVREEDVWPCAAADPRTTWVAELSIAGISEPPPAPLSGLRATDGD